MSRKEISVGVERMRCVSGVVLVGEMGQEEEDVSLGGWVGGKGA